MNDVNSRHEYVFELLTSRIKRDTPCLAVHASVVRNSTMLSRLHDDGSFCGQLAFGFGRGLAWVFVVGANGNLKHVRR
jgi:hypothetical protein